MTSSSSSLGDRYRDLWADQLLDRLVEDKRSDVLEALWRVDDVNVAGRVASRLAQAGIQELADLLAEEVVSSRMSQAGYEGDVVSAISQYSPPLTPRGTQLLVEGLNEEEELDGEYENARSTLERWAIKQLGPVAEAFACQVLHHDTEASGESFVRVAALRRLIGTPSLDPELSALALGLENEQDGSWEAAIEAIETLADQVGRLKNGTFARLVASVVRAAADEADAPFSPELERVVSTVGYGALKEVLSGDPLAISIGAVALATAAEAVGRRAQRLTLFSTMVVIQPELYEEVIPQVAPSWSDEEWAARLERLTRLGSNVVAGLVGTLVEFAPTTQSDVLVRLVAERSDEGDDLVAAVAQKVRTRLEANDAEVAGSQLEALWWPDCPDVVADRVQAILVEAVGAEDACRYVLAALKGRKIDVALAARLIPEAAVDFALCEIDDGQAARNLCAALHTIYPTETEIAVRALQQEGFSLDFADAIAPKAPGPALAGTRAAWKELSTAACDRLFELVVTYGGEDQRELLADIASDTSKPNRHRRGRAATRLAELLPEGDTPPEYVLELLSSNSPDLRRDGVEAIGILKPRDESVINRLHEAAGERGPAGRAARDVLEVLGQVYDEDLREATSVEETVQGLTLVGHAARPGAVSRLIEYLGPDANDENLKIRRAAASAVAAACRRSDPSVEEHEALVELLDGDAQEVDPDAQRSLAEAVNAIVLGPDESLARLYEMVGHTPKLVPDDLFHAEKGPLVRQIQLFIQAAARGAVGRGYAIAHLDLAAEALVRAAYVRYGESEPIETRIRTGERKDVKYGELLQALASVKELKGIQGNLLTLHELRGERTEVTHVGSPASEEEFTSANTAFKRAAGRCLRLLDA